MRIRYHLFRNQTAFSKPGGKALCCIKCGQLRQGEPTAAELSSESCVMAKRWHPPCWVTEGDQEQNSRRRSVANAIEGGCVTFDEIVTKLGAPEKAHWAIKEWLDWLLFNGLVTLGATGWLKITALGTWMTQERYRNGPRPSILIPGESEALNRARAKRSNDLRRDNRPEGAPVGDPSNFDRLKLLLLNESLTREQIESLSLAITQKFSLRLKKGAS